MLYFIGIGAGIGWLLLVRPEQGSTRTRSLRRLAGLGLGLSVAAWWDAVAQVATLPVALFGFVLPAWLVVMMSIGAIALLLLYLLTARHLGTRGGI